MKESKANCWRSQRNESKSELVVQETEDEDDEIKFLTAEALRGVDSLIFDERPDRILRRRKSYSSWTRWRIGHASRCAATGADGPDSALRFSSCSSSTSFQRFYSAGNAENRCSSWPKWLARPLLCPGRPNPNKTSSLAAHFKLGRAISPFLAAQTSFLHVASNSPNREVDVLA